MTAPNTAALVVRADKLLHEALEWKDMYLRVANERDNLLIDIEALQRQLAEARGNVVSLGKFSMQLERERDSLATQVETLREALEPYRLALYRIAFVAGNEASLRAQAVAALASTQEPSGDADAG